MKVDKNELDDMYTDEYLQSRDRDITEYELYIREVYSMEDYVQDLDAVLPNSDKISNKNLLDAVRYGIDSIVITPEEVGTVIYANLVAEKVFEYLNQFKKKKSI